MISRMDRRGLRSSSSRGRLALPAAVLLLLAHLSTQAHMLLVPHAISSVDAQIVHPRSIASPTCTPAHHSKHARLDFDARQHGDDDDDHCRVALQLREPSAGCHPPRCIGMAPGPALAPDEIAPASPQPGLAVHRVAPKQSPPA
jgi:hypothetical protein